MRILVVGSGGREHALAWALSRSANRPELFIAPGNPGTATLGKNLSVSATDLDGIREVVRREKIDLVVVGPEQPLVIGLADALRADGCRVVGPSAAAARLEGSKAFAKDFMQRHGIPSASHRTFSRNEYDAAVAYLEEQGAPIVIKASGLAAGKGAIVCETYEEARSALDLVLRDDSFREAGDHVVIEEFMRGEEVSIFAVTDGKDYVLLSPAQDHKRLGDGDTGPNTGGMGAYAPAPVATEDLVDRVKREIIEPTLEGMAAEGNPYSGFLYCGLMVTDGPRVVEFNCRLGDPEAQVVLPLLESDLVDVCEAVVKGRVGELSPRIREGACACVVLASEGYPGAYRKGSVISGLDVLADREDVFVFHAGTQFGSDNRIVTSGGRVLGVTAVGKDLRAALATAYGAVETIHFDGMQYRRDIGQKGLARLQL